MRFRGAPRYGGITYYQLIGSVYAGEPVQVGDTWGSNSHERDRLLRQYAGVPTMRRVSLSKQKVSDDPTQREDSTPDTQQPAAERSEAPS